MSPLASIQPRECDVILVAEMPLANKATIAGSNFEGPMQKLKRNDRLPRLEANLQSNRGAPIDLTACTVKFLMRPAGGGAAKINAAATIVGDPTYGNVSYAWGATDTDTSGKWEAELEITDAGGLKQTVPNQYISIEIIDDVA